MLTRMSERLTIIIVMSHLLYVLGLSFHVAAYKLKSCDGRGYTQETHATFAQRFAVRMTR